MNKYKEYLTENILSFWIEHAFDRELCGMFTSLDKEGNVICNDKSVLFTGRSLWTFAHAYNTIEKRKEYLDACESLYAFYKKCTLPNGRLPFLAKRNGEAIEKRESFHVEAFAAMGCAAYYKACKREDVKKSAIDFFEIVLRIYNEKVTTTMKKDDVIYNIMGAEMMILNICQFMRSSGIEDIRFEKLIDEAINNIKTYGFIDDRNKRVREYAPVGYPDVSCESVYTCFGHLYELAWFMMSEGAIKENSEICDLGKKIMDYALNMESDICPVRTSNTGYEYLWWPQCEALAAFALGYNIYGDKEYKENFDTLFRFTMEKFADKENGEWIMSCDKGGNALNSNKGGLFKGPFHLPRLFMMLSCLEDDGSIIKYMS